MANPLTSITCSVRWDNARVVSWTMMPNGNYPADFTLQVENSRAGGPWEVLAAGLEGSCSYIDTRKRNYNKRLNECYRIRLTSASTGEDYVSDVVDAGNHKAYPYSADAENVIKQAQSQIEESGCSGRLLKRRLWGQPCPLCVDFSGQSTVNEHCPRCLGTGIDGGYFPGIPLWIIKDAISTNETTSELGYVQGETVTGRCIAYPFIDPGDVWAEDYTNKRFVISKVVPSASFRQTALVYSIELHKVELSDVLHSDDANKLVASKNEHAQAGSYDNVANWDSALDTL